jgi:hypothetical protein
MRTQLLCPEEQAKAIIEQIRNPESDEKLCRALNDAIDYLDSGLLEVALRNELENQGIDLDQLLERYPNVGWRKPNPNDPNRREGFTVKR